MKGTDYRAFADKYASHRHVHPGVLTRLISVVDRSARVLEVGCGTGNYIAAIQEAVGCECVGLDPSPEMLAQLRARECPVQPVEAPAERLDVPDEAFDVVYFVDVIHHVVDRNAAFREASRALRGGGRICIVTDSEWIIRHREPLSVYFPETIEVELCRYPGVDTLRSEMARAGFNALSEDIAEHAYDLSSSVAYRDKVFSALRHLSDGAFLQGLARLEADLRAGPVPCTSRYALVWGTKPARS